MSEALTDWRKCSSCKKQIAFETRYWVCSVSTCNRPRTGLVFCTTTCWDAHVPLMNHRESWAEERVSPTRAQIERERASLQALRPAESSSGSSAARGTSGPGAAREPVRRIVGPSPGARKPAIPRDVLVVVSKLKIYVRARSDMNTSDSVVDVLSDKLRELCDDAIERARKAGRKTVLERDFDAEGGWE